MRDLTDLLRLTNLALSDSESPFHQLYQNCEIAVCLVTVIEYTSQNQHRTVQTSCSTAKLIRVDWSDNSLSR